MSVEIDIQQVAGDAARQLGALNGETTLELVVTRAANTKLSGRVAELEQALADKVDEVGQLQQDLAGRDAENGRLQQVNELLQQRIADLEEQRAEETRTD